MAVKTGWKEEGIVITQEYHGTLTASDLETACKAIAELAKQSTKRRVHFILDVTGVTAVNKNVEHHHSRPELHGKNRGWTVLIGGKHSALPADQSEIMSNALKQMLGFRFRHFSTFDDGEKFIKNIREMVAD